MGEAGFPSCPPCPPVSPLPCVVSPGSARLPARSSSSSGSSSGRLPSAPPGCCIPEPALLPHPPRGRRCSVPRCAGGRAGGEGGEGAGPGPPPSALSPACCHRARPRSAPARPARRRHFVTARRSRAPSERPRRGSAEL